LGYLIVTFNKTAKIKQSLKRRKFVESGRPESKQTAAVVTLDLYGLGEDFH
jgi:hypothetical protein